MFEKYSIFVTQDILDFLKKKKSEEQWQIGDIADITDQYAGKLRVYRNVKDGSIAALPMHLAGQAHTQYMLLILHRIAHSFYYELATLANAFFVDMKRIPKEGFFGVIAMTDHPDNDQMRKWTVINGVNGQPNTAYMRFYNLKVKDEELLTNPNALEDLKRIMAVNLKMMYADDKWHLQPIERRS